MRDVLNTCLVRLNFECCQLGTKLRVLDGAMSSRFSLKLDNPPFSSKLFPILLTYRLFDKVVLECKVDQMDSRSASLLTASVWVAP